MQLWSSRARDQESFVQAHPNWSSLKSGHVAFAEALGVSGEQSCRLYGVCAVQREGQAREQGGVAAARLVELHLAGTDSVNEVVLSWFGENRLLSSVCAARWGGDLVSIADAVISTAQMYHVQAAILSPREGRRRHAGLGPEAGEPRAILWYLCSRWRA